MKTCENIFKPFKCESHFRLFWTVRKIVYNGVVDGNIDITVLNGDTIGATTKNLDGNAIIFQDKLNSLKSNNSGFMIKVSLRSNHVSELLDIKQDLFLYEIVQKRLFQKRF